MRDFAKLKKKQLLTVDFVNNERHEYIRFIVFKITCTQNYYLVIEKTTYTYQGVVRRLIEKYTDGDIIEELKRAIKYAADDMVLSLFFINTNLKRKAKIPYTTKDMNNFEESLEKLSKILDKRKKWDVKRRT